MDKVDQELTVTSFKTAFALLSARSFGKEMVKTLTWIAIVLFYLAAVLFCVVLLIVTFPLFVLTTISSLSFTSSRMLLTVLLMKLRSYLRERNERNDSAKRSPTTDS